MFIECTAQTIAVRNVVIPAAVCTTVDCLDCKSAREQNDILGGLLVERRTSVSQIRGSIPGQVAAV